MVIAAMGHFSYLIFAVNCCLCVRSSYFIEHFIRNKGIFIMKWFIQIMQLTEMLWGNYILNINNDFCDNSLLLHLLLS